MDNNEIVGPDGEFRRPVDARYGVYSVRKRGYWWRLSITLLGTFIIAFGILALVWWAYT